MGNVVRMVMLITFAIHCIALGVLLLVQVPFFPVFIPNGLVVEWADEIRDPMVVLTGKAKNGKRTGGASVAVVDDVLDLEFSGVLFPLGRES